MKSTRDLDGNGRFSRRALLKWMGASAAVVALAGCAPVGQQNAPAGAGAAPAEGNRLEIWTGFGQGRMADAMGGAIERFSEEHPDYAPEHVVIPWGEIHDKVLAATSAGSPPDSYRGWSWIVADDAAIGGLTQLDDYIAAAGVDLNDYWDAAVAQMKYKGNVYAMSISSIVPLYFYNKDRMREGGFDPEQLPTTLEGWVEMGDALTEVSASGEIEKVGFIPQIPSFNAVNNWGPAFGVQMWDPEALQITANSPAGVAMMEWAKSYRDKYRPEEIQAFITSHGGNTFGRNTPQGVYYTGLLAIWAQGSWSYNDMGEYGPEVDFGVTSLPSPAGVAGKPGAVNANMYFVPAGANNSQGGFDFANFMSVSPWVAINKAGPDSVTPSRKTNATLPELESAQPWVAFARDQILPNADAISGMPASAFFARSLNEALEAVLFNDADPAAALADAVERSQAEVDKKLNA
jgi:multiple sugar transport system substrate-binding protein